LAAPRKLVVQAIIASVILAGLIVLSVYFAWTDYLSFHNAIMPYFGTWDWDSLYPMIVSIFLSGFLVGMGIALYLLIRGVQRDYQRTTDREKLKEEIKKELEMERQKENEGKT